MLLVSMDGPSVNGKLMENLKMEHGTHTGHVLLVIQIVADWWINSMKQIHIIVVIIIIIACISWVLASMDCTHYTMPEGRNIVSLPNSITSWLTQGTSHLSWQNTIHDTDVPIEPNPGNDNLLASLNSRIEYTEGELRRGKTKSDIYEK